MKAQRLVKSSLRAMARYKLRSGFMMLGSLVGVAALTFVISIGATAERKLLGTVRQLFGASSIVVSAGGGFFMGGSRAEAARLTIDDLETIAQELPGIEVWDPLQVLPGAQLRRAEQTTTARLMGQSERSERVWERGTTSGEYFDAAAVAGSARVALIGETVARELFGDQDPLGEEILIGSVPFRVVGILERFGTDVHGMDRDAEVVVPISTAMRRVMNVDSIRAAKLLVKDPSLVEETTRQVKRILRERHALAAGQPDDFTVVTSLAVQKMVGRIERVFFLYLPLVAGVSLLAGGAVAGSLMLASVNERVAEIGLRRAVGARPEDIRAQFLIETAVTTLGGGVMGIVIGGAGALLLASRMGLGGVLSGQAIALGIVLSTVTGLLAGLLPARRAALLQPADALR
ncbi:MAG TPA: ABC transporter permease [Vicinamibacteria bacterium]|nr:ABC transporter permease [Vicinamibacteria bacterium]